ncbi:MAG: cell division protein ZapA [Clostridiales bacterium]|nr:cell division protein ZapA [Clostridiales bacterium]
MAKEAILQVELDGLTYVLRGSGDVEKLRKIADTVAQKIAATRAHSPHYSSTRTAMLAALQITEEMLTLQDEYLEMLEAADIGATNNSTYNKEEIKA